MIQRLTDAEIGELRKRLTTVGLTSYALSYGQALALLSEVEEARAKIKKYEARLEIDHYFVLDPDAPDGMRRVDAPMEFPDGIECRDATIKLLEERIAELLRTEKIENRPDGLGQKEIPHDR